MSDQLSPLSRFQNIVLATDGTDISTGAVRVALNMASQCGSQLTVMHMAPTYPGYAMFNPAGVGEAEQAGMTVLKQVEAQAGTAVDDDSLLVGQHHFDAGGIAAELQGLGPRSGDGTPGAPEFYLHTVGFLLPPCLVANKVAREPPPRLIPSQ